MKESKECEEEWFQGRIRRAAIPTMECTNEEDGYFPRWLHE